MNIFVLLIILLLLGVFGGGPYYGWHQYVGGPTPFYGIGGVLLLILIILLITGRL